MSDLISRADAIEAVESNSYGMGSRASIGAIKALPSADAVQVVLCKDCRYSHECHKCVHYTRDEPRQVTMGYIPIEFCSHGERRSDE